MIGPSRREEERAFHPGGLAHERAPWLALLPVAATFGFYLSPRSLRQWPLAQFMPQIAAYVALLWWARVNGETWKRLGLESSKVREGMRWGAAIGIVLGVINLWVILWLVPRLGRDIDFLRRTPHAQIPAWIMLPWFIGLIACVVEVNFRGFQLGRLEVVARGLCPSRAPEMGGLLALLISATMFAFDPFLVATFKHLHWIAMWDGLIWGTMWMRRRNLYIPIVAHAVEVVILYSVVRIWLEL